MPSSGLAYHAPLAQSWAWGPKLIEAVKELKPSIGLGGHTHYLQWSRPFGVTEFISAGMGWSKMGSRDWTGYFIHVFYKNKVVSSFKRLGCDDLFFTNITSYRKN